MSYAYIHRPAELFQKLFYQVLGNVTPPGSVFSISCFGDWWLVIALPVGPDGRLRKNEKGDLTVMDAEIQSLRPFTARRRLPSGCGESTRNDVTAAIPAAVNAIGGKLFGCLTREQ